MNEHIPNKDVPRFPWALLIRVLAACALVGFVAYRSDLGRVWNALGQIDLAALGKAMLLYGALQVLSATKWGLILKSQSGPGSNHVPYPRLILFYFMGMFANLFFPSSVGGDALRTVMVSPFAGGMGKGSLSILMERATGFFAMITIGLMASVLIANSVGSQPGTRMDAITTTGALILLGGAVACLVFFTATILFRKMVLIGRVPRWTTDRLRRLLRDFAECLENFGRNSGLLLAVFGVSFVFQLGFVCLTWLIMKASGVELSFVYLCYFHPVLSTISFIPLTPNALGVREVTVTALLAAQGLPNHLALLFCLCTYIVMTTLSLPGALAIVFMKTDLASIARSRRRPPDAPSP
ncbi:MAG: hypothetical protein AUJ92_19690 [Armatimonadetes bacterium CG2_30_59_28]|nr:flippase-like domain-containing protein [Armatimonadota bacterium]OIO90035.1 MAG: hypothetical protein AUJ92_19690 [Armatimonadetes bacterium CG2_30_59_28]